MKKNRIIILLAALLFSLSSYGKDVSLGFVNAADFGFSPDASGIENTKALQAAVDNTGTIIVSRPGTYKIAGTVYVGSNTSLKFGNNILLKKVDEQGSFSHVIVNKGAKSKTYDTNISIEGLQIEVNNIDVNKFDVAYGLRGHLAFFYVKDLKIDRFRCLDLGKLQFCIHVCTFEDIIINDVIIKGDKDGIHLGPGNRFTIRNGVFESYDDAIELNGHDYSTSNPEMGWIENGVIENCYDLPDGKRLTGYFCRILAGGWIDWKPGMEVQQSDAVVSNGRVYRVQMEPDGKTYKSVTQPTHTSGSMVIDGIKWGVVQQGATYTAGVRNVVFRDIFLQKPRTGFSIHFDNDRFSRSYYPGAAVPMQEQLTFENVKVITDEPFAFLSVNTPVDAINITGCSFRNSSMNFHGNKAMTDYLKTKINMIGCVFNYDGEMTLLKNSVENKQIILNTSSSIEINDHFKAKVLPAKGTIIINSDLTGLK